MFVYYAFFLLSLFFGWLSLFDTKSRKLREKPRLVLFCASGLVLALMLGFRKGVGTDFYEIYSFSYDIALVGQKTRFEIGYDFINRVLALFGASNEIYFLVVACLTVGLVYRAIYKTPVNPLWCIFIFQFGGLWFYATNGMRQALAVAILLNAIPHLLNKSFLRYLIWVAAASSIHMFALVFIPLYFLRTWRIDSIKSILILVAFFAFSGFIANAGLEIAANMSSQFAAYMRHESFNYAGNIDLTDLLLCAIPLFLYFISIKFVKTSSYFTDVNYYFLLMVLGVLSAALSNNVFIFSRVASFFTPFSILAMPYLFETLDDAKVDYSFFVKAFYSAILIGSSYYLFGILEIHNVIPYISVFSEYI